MDKLTVVWKVRPLESGRVGGSGPPRRQSRPPHVEYGGHGLLRKLLPRPFRNRYDHGFSEPRRRMKSSGLPGLPVCEEDWLLLLL